MANFSLKAKARIKIKEDNVRLVSSIGFCEYYYSFVRKEFPGLTLGLPRYGAHCNIISPRFHSVSDDDLKKIKHFENQKVHFYYDPYVHKVTGRAGHTSFYINIRSDVIDEIKSLVHIEKTCYNMEKVEDHFSICNNKNFFKNNN